MRLPRLLVLVLMFSSLFVLAGCKAQEVRERAAKTEAAAEAAIAAKGKVDAAIDAARQLPDSEQVKAIRDALPPDAQPGFDKAIAGGKRAIETAKEISGAMGESAQVLLAQFRDLQQQLAKAEADEDVTLQVIAWGLAAAFPVLSPLIAVFANRRGQAKGATHVATAIAKGRNEDDAFNKAFEGPTGEVIKAAMNTNPRIAGVVRAHKTV